MKDITLISLARYLAQATWLLLISPVIVPAALITLLVAGRDAMSIEGGMVAGMTFAAAAFGIVMLYIGLAIGYLV